MNRNVCLLAVVLAAVLVFTGSVSCVGARARDGLRWFQAGQVHEQHQNYQRAYKCYLLSARWYYKHGDEEGMRQAKDAAYRVLCYLLTYNKSYKRVLAESRKTCLRSDKQLVPGWLASIHPECLVMNGGKTYYFSQVAENLKYRNAAAAKSYNELNGYPFDVFLTHYLARYVTNEAPAGYSNPVEMLVDFQFRIKRRALPKRGTIKVWWPMPIATDCQTAGDIIYFEPAHYIAGTATTDIGIVYLAIPVTSLTGDLQIRSQVRFTHYQQRFIVDPAQVGAYDTASELYLRYTASTGNTIYSEAIRQTAADIVGTQTNPYLAAKLLYEYVLSNILYSVLPHGAITAAHIPESVFVHEHRYGDCGAMGMYFAALCRSQGIPTRTTGGYQFLFGEPSTHFWTEVYIPNYGWLPVDPSVAKAISTLAGPDMAPQKELLSQYLFGNQDPMRMVIQTDVDIPLAPLPSEAVDTMVLQSPVSVFEGYPTLADGDFFRYCQMHLNSDHMITVHGGEEFTLNAEDFNLATLPEDARFYAFDHQFGATKTFAIVIVGTAPDKRSAQCRLASAAEMLPLVYPIYLQRGTEPPVKATRFLKLASTRAY